MSKSDRQQKPTSGEAAPKVFRLSGGRLVAHPAGTPAPPPAAAEAAPASQPPAPAAPAADQIRELAYAKWEAAGRPAGDGAEFWLMAEAELQNRPAEHDVDQPS